MNNDTTLKAKSKLKFHEFSIISFGLSLSIIIVMLLILINPVRYAESVINGLKLFFTAVLPGLLPFVFLTRLLTELNVINKISKPLQKPMKTLFGVSNYGFYAFLMSMISGYPIGSKITSDLAENGQISDDEITKIALLSSTSGPIFVIGAVGGAMLKNAKLGLLIYVSNILAVIICSLIINLFSKKRKTIAIVTPASEKKNKIQLFSIAKDSVISLLIVGFYIALFSLFIDLLKDLNILSFLATMSDNILGKLGIHGNYSLGIMSGIIEMTNGAKMLSSTINPLSVSLISFVIAFSGISIIMQSLSFLSKTKIKTSKFILGKLFQAIMTFLICLVLTSLFM